MNNFELQNKSKPLYERKVNYNIFLMQNLDKNSISKKYLCQKFNSWKTEL